MEVHRTSALEDFSEVSTINNPDVEKGQIVDDGPDKQEVAPQQLQQQPPTDKVDYSKLTLAVRPWRLQTNSYESIIKHNYSGSGTKGDPYIVTWLPDDVENARNYTTVKRWSVTMLVASMTLSVAMASSAYTGAIRPMIEYFKCSEEVIVLGLSLMLLGYACGPLLWGPISEVWGRREVTLITLLMYTIFCGGCVASQNIETLLILRFFCGVFGSSSFVVPGGQIYDLFDNEERGYAMGVFVAAPVLGPALGPMIGGFLGEVSWRWVLALLACYAGAVFVLIFLFCPETYGPVLLRRRAKLLSDTTGKVYLTGPDAKKPLDIKQKMKESLLRPWVILFLEPIVLIITIYMSVIYGTLYMLFSAFPIVFQELRGWSAGVGGLAFMGVLVGMIFGVAYIIWDNVRYIRICRAHNGNPPPECRLPPAILGGAFLIIGMAWFAAANGPSVHWIVPIIAGAPFAFGLLLVFICLAAYLVDSYSVYAASVLAGNSVMRSTIGAAFPLFTSQMYKKLGIHWASSIPAFIALACFPFPILFYLHGEKLRLKCKYAARAVEEAAALQQSH